MTTPDFELEGVVHLVRPAFLEATDLESLRAGIAASDDETLFLHALQCRLRLPAAHEHPPDDFSAWVNGVVQDRETAERLLFAAQRRGGTAEALRASLLGVLETVPEKARRARTAPAEATFIFLAAESVRVPTGVVVSTADALFAALGEADASVWFYHFIERPWFDGQAPAPATWLRAIGEGRTAAWLEEAAAAGLPIEMLRRQVLARWRRRHLGRRVADLAARSDDQRRDVGHEAVTRLVRRLKQGGGRS